MVVTKDLADKFFSIERLSLDRRHGDARIGKHILDKLVQAPGSTDNAIQKSVSFLIQPIGISSSEQLGKAPHRSEWCSQIVGKAVRKAFEFSNCFPELGGALGDNQF